MTTAVSVLPGEVLAAYGMGPQAVVLPMGDGKTNTINQNFEVISDAGHLVVQRIAPIFDGEAVTNDFDASTRYLEGLGWEVPRVVETIDGKMIVTAEDGEYRASGYIEWDGKVPPYNLDLMRNIGAVLARFHVDMARLDYEPQNHLPHFHDTKFYMSTLVDVQPEIPDEGTRQLAAKILAQYHENPDLPEGDEQLIHGDPRADNFLYRNGQPFTLIDFDTVMRGSVWLDIGDFLRSAGEEERIKGRILGHAAVAAFCEAYREVALPDTDPEEFRQNALAAAQLIALELAARFAIDNAKDEYFAPPPGRDRREYVAERAAQQWDIYQDLSRLKEER